LRSTIALAAAVLLIGAAPRAEGPRDPNVKKLGTAAERLTFHRNQFAIVTPAGTKFPVASVTLFFESPDRHWREGSYQLVIGNGRARAVLPVELK